MAEFNSRGFPAGIRETITISAPISRAKSTGTLLETNPSTNKRLSMVTGAKIPGIDILARTANGRLPFFKTTASPVRISVATARNGIGNLSKSLIFATGASKRRSSNIKRCPLTTPPDNLTPFLSRPKRVVLKKSEACCFC